MGISNTIMVCLFRDKNGCMSHVCSHLSVSMLMSQSVCLDKMLISADFGLLIIIKDSFAFFMELLLSFWFLPLVSYM